MKVTKQLITAHIEAYWAISEEFGWTWLYKMKIKSVKKFFSKFGKAYCANGTGILPRDREKNRILNNVF
jgi:hypothetical protein